MGRKGEGVPQNVTRVMQYISGSRWVCRSLHRNLWLFWSWSLSLIWRNIFLISAMIPTWWHLNLIRTCPRSGWSFGPLRRQELRDCPSYILALLLNTTLHFVVALSSQNTPWWGRYLILSALWSSSSIGRAWPSSMYWLTASQYVLAFSESFVNLLSVETSLWYACP